jgi:hypothetical protein
MNEEINCCESMRIVLERQQIKYFWMDFEPDISGYFFTDNHSNGRSLLGFKLEYCPYCSKKIPVVDNRYW